MNPIFVLVTPTSPTANIVAIGVMPGADLITQEGDAFVYEVDLETIPLTTFQDVVTHFGFEVNRQQFRAFASALETLLNFPARVADPWMPHHHSPRMRLPQDTRSRLKGVSSHPTMKDCYSLLVARQVLLRHEYDPTQLIVLLLEQAHQSVLNNGCYELAVVILSHVDDCIKALAPDETFREHTLALLEMFKQRFANEQENPHP
jgi:hypothetical protein